MVCVGRVYFCVNDVPQRDFLFGDGFLLLLFELPQFLFHLFVGLCHSLLPQLLVGLQLFPQLLLRSYLLLPGAAPGRRRSFVAFYSLSIFVVDGSKQYLWYLRQDCWFPSA